MPIRQNPLSSDSVAAPDVQFRLRVFWASTIFSLGVLWGLANVVYCPVAAMTSVVGSTWLEVGIVLAGGILTLSASIRAFFRRRAASWELLLGGAALFILAAAGQSLSTEFGARGPINLVLLFLAGLVPLSLGIFGVVTERQDWPPLRSGR